MGNSNFRRRLKNLWIHPPFQTRVLIWIFLSQVGLLFFMSLVLLCGFKSSANLSGVLQYMYSDPGVNFAQEVRWFGALLGFTFFIYLVAQFALSLILTHRILGPILKLETELEKIQTVDQLKQISFRKGDEFSNLERAYNQMVARIKRQN